MRRCIPGPIERSLLPVTERALELAMTAAQAAADKKAQDIVVIDVAEQLYITDAFVIASAANERQGRWVLLDYIDIVIHIQHAEEREFYALDRLWKDCPTIPFVDRDMVDSSSGVA